MKIIHFSDPHAGGGAEDWRAYFDKRWVGVFNYRFRRRDKHDLGRLKRAVEYIIAARPDVAIPLYERFVAGLRTALGPDRVGTGRFGADMKVRLLNDGPFTVELEESAAARPANCRDMV